MHHSSHSTQFLPAYIYIIQRVRGGGGGEGGGGFRFGLVLNGCLGESLGGAAVGGGLTICSPIGWMTW